MRHAADGIELQLLDFNRNPTKGRHRGNSCTIKTNASSRLKSETLATFVEASSMRKVRTLSYQEARAFYDSLGSKLDYQRFHEDPAMTALVAHSDLRHASAVVELGCGTGRLAEKLLREHLPTEASYVGFDVSRTMVGLTRVRLEPWMDRAEVHLTEGSPRLPLGDGKFDRFLSTYVLDLLSEDDIQATLREARRLLIPGGRLCLAAMTIGRTIPSRLVSLLWSTIHSASPRVVGGSRPICLAAFAGSPWQILHRETVCALGICTDLLIAL